LGGWRLVRTPNPHGGADAISIMRTADMSRSDLELAGLTVRCGEGGAEVLVVLLRPFAPRAQPRVSVRSDGSITSLNARVVPPGAALLLPPDASALVRGPWQALAELAIEVQDEQRTIRGVVQLTGLQPAYRLLMATCAERPEPSR
jgi:hypothetical protein